VRVDATCSTARVTTNSLRTRPSDCLRRKTWSALSDGRRRVTRRSSSTLDMEDEMLEGEQLCNRSTNNR
jgi:hypothetical protein